MRILITGGKGQLGRALQGQLSDHDLVIVDLPEIDVTDRQVIEEEILGVRPELVIHCAAYTDVDGCAANPALAYQVNALGTQNTALACRAAGADMLHLSTNEVFAGNHPDGYEEWMSLNPINAYGRSKAAAEAFVRTIAPRYYIVRTAWLYTPGGRNFIHAILERAQKIGKIRVVADEIGNPTYAADLAQAIAQLIDLEQYGIYHFVNEGACSRWAFANEILALAGCEDVINDPILAREYKRASIPPPYGALLNKAGAAIGINLRPWQEALADFMGNHIL
jgi:dTDP-4-dehydrorhamnose reductase